ncbi:DUF6350 family protein [Propioniciclava soli]|uniref:cell division protein PerM n=1 Tax=Propioniciclava soli TaxID=2775081 RepID=UPI001E521F54|nr:DUF6350 family protein [Propioniciclava soli]
MPTSHSTRPARLPLTVSSPGEPEASETAPLGMPHVPWLAAALVWSAAVAVMGLATVAVLVIVGWLTALRTAPSAVVQTVGQVWLSVHGVAAEVHPLTWHLAPLTVTFTLGAVCAVVAHHVAGQIDPDGVATPRSRWLAWAGLVAACGVAYAAACGLISSVIATPEQAGAVLAPAFALAATGAALGGLRGAELDPGSFLPGRARRLPGAIGVGVTVLAAGALLALAVGLVAHHEQVSAAVEALGPDAVGSALLVLLHLSYGPNIVGWAGSYVLGAGVTFGPGTLVTPGTTQVGALPAVPVFGALPVVPSLWSWGFLAVGPLAGAAAAWWMLRRPVTDPDTHAATPGGGIWTRGNGAMAPFPRVHMPLAAVTIVWAALAGLATAAVWVGFSWLTRGDLGTERLVGMGPVFPDLLWWAAGSITAGALVVGGIVALRAHGRRSGPPTPPQEESEPVGVGASAAS